MDDGHSIFLIAGHSVMLTLACCSCCGVRLAREHFELCFAVGCWRPLMSNSLARASFTSSRRTTLLRFTFSWYAVFSRMTMRLSRIAIFAFRAVNKASSAATLMSERLVISVGLQRVGSQKLMSSAISKSSLSLARHRRTWSFSHPVNSCYQHILKVEASFQGT